MKITFIYAHDVGEVWSTPMSLINEFKKRSWETEIISIGSNKSGIYEDSKLRSWIQKNTPTDIVMFMDWGRFDSNWLDKSLKPDTFWIQESGDDPQNFERNYPKANRFHFTITPSANSAEEYKKRGINCLWIPHWADTAVQYPINTEPKYVAVTTRGIGGSQFLDYLTEWGDGAIGNKNGMGPQEHTEFLNSGLMVLQNSRWKELTRRLFEGMACGKMVITDRLPKEAKLDELFIEGEEIVLYDDIVDCIEKINYYNENIEERERIAKNGMKKVLENYTQVQVVDKLIELWKNYQSV
ncbi:Glycosyl transferases group 1 [uncultured Caudovirales phage]|uniref:Glycosyl transferases group 1 n=1 Tax=uncultured Caudovirales phage TaxID=2100421 RepID=A0A6J5MAU2_9CAUD|nr:Glycosyl transferases group 1 [uncultured Caudovirales phage]